MTMRRVAENDPAKTGTLSHVDPETGEITKIGDFALEPDPPPGTVPDVIIGELRRCYRQSKDYAAALAEALKAQAEKHRISPGALKRYIAALEKDSTEEAEQEAEDLMRLIQGPDDE